MIYWGLLILIALIFIIFIKTHSNYWQRKRVVYKKTWPIVGGLKDFILRRKNLGYLVQDWYKEFPNESYYGFYLLSVEALLIKDIELIKKITIKDFEYFSDHINVTDVDQEPIFGKNLSALKGLKWREMRNVLTPSFTGNKIRIMFGLISECAKQLNEHLLKNQEEIIQIEAKDLMSRVAIDVISTIAFGIESNSLNNDSIFYKIGTSITKSNPFIFIYALIQIFFPKIAKKFNLSQLPSSEMKNFENMIKEALEKRTKENINRPDMIQILIQAKKDKNEEITINDIIAQGFIFFLAGFEPISTLLAHLCNELALNPSVQEKLQSEIDETFLKSELNYESLIKMKYLDMVISETLRLWPPSAFTNRECVRDYIIKRENTNEEDLLIERGVGVVIPIFGIHRDEKFYPNPDKFDPERFNEENKPDLNPYAFMPFGIGPRNCIGSRLALLETKIIIVYLLRKFNIITVDKTQIPVVLSPKKAALMPESFWLGLKRRNFSFS